MKDSSAHWRTLLKAITWESFSWFLTTGVMWAFTGDIASSSLISTVLLGLKIIFLYIHDRIWHQIPLGKKNVQNS